MWAPATTVLYLSAWPPAWMIIGISSPLCLYFSPVNLLMIELDSCVCFYLLYFFFPCQVKFWSQHISFILVGIIIVTSIRGLLITLTKVKLSSRGRAQKSYICLLLLICLTKTYILLFLQFFYAISSSKSSNVIVLVLAQIMVSVLLPICLTTWAIRSR